MIALHWSGRAATLVPIGGRKGFDVRQGRGERMTRHAVLNPIRAIGSSHEMQTRAPRLALSGFDDNGPSRQFAERDIRDRAAAAFHIEKN